MPNFYFTSIGRVIAMRLRNNDPYDQEELHRQMRLLNIKVRREVAEAQQLLQQRRITIGQDTRACSDLAFKLKDFADNLEQNNVHSEWTCAATSTSTSRHDGPGPTETENPTSN